MSKLDQGKELLARIDVTLDSLTQLRGELNNWLKELEGTAAYAHAPYREDASKCLNESNGSKEENLQAGAHNAGTSVSCTSDLLAGKESVYEEMEEVVFVPKGCKTDAGEASQRTLDRDKVTPQSPTRMRFYPRRRLSLADTFLFANEFFMGNRAELNQLLDDIEHLSSSEEVDHLLFNIIRLDRDSETAQHFLDLVLRNSEVVSE